MDLAALHDPELAVHLGDRAPERFGTVDDKEHGPISRKPPREEVGEECGGNPSILGASLAKSQNMLSTRRIHAQRHQQAVFPEHLPVDEHHPDVELVEGAGEELMHLPGGERDESSRYRGSRGRMLHHTER